ncbi:hypothetical protein HLH89_34115 [Rhizobium laguerreae]|nr:hypothetical protein [Rhizobium laguerreae]
MTLEIGKNAVTALGMKPVQLVFEKRFEIHHMLPVYTAKRYIGRGSSVFDLCQVRRKLLAPDS